MGASESRPRLSEDQDGEPTMGMRRGEQLERAKQQLNLILPSFPPVQLHDKDITW